MSKTLESLRAQGNDVDTALSRFMGNEALYQKFLKKFPADENFVKLGEALSEKRYRDAFACSHTLKGVAGTLGLDRILERNKPILELLRAKERHLLNSGGNSQAQDGEATAQGEENITPEDEQLLSSWMKELDAAYRDTMQILNEMA